MEFQEVIAHRRDGIVNPREELEMLARGAADGSIPDYQLSAWLMAAYLEPLNAEETAWLTEAMADSGDRLDLTGLPKPWVDKHSTGGVGDKTSIILLPLLASCGMTIVKMSGRGLGITGGTVDKLESVPGFRMDLDPSELIDQARRIGLANTGQTAALAPADRTLYALRDVTATVDSIPLLVSSIMSKKLAGGSERVVLDVKCGSGGFMTDLDGAERLAEALSETGKRIGLPAHVAITDMSQPLGRAVGNLLEVKEAAQVLQGEKGRMRDLCLQLAAHALVASGLAKHSEALSVASKVLDSGTALVRAREWFKAQGATIDVFDHPEQLAVAPVQRVVASPISGYVHQVDARAVGEVVVALGGGRERKTDEIDPTVGVECHQAVGDEVESGQPAFTVHARNEEEAKAAGHKLLTGLRIAESKVQPPPLVLKLYP
jgi:pyrimidine-nucleoside phosphorylase